MSERSEHDRRLRDYGCVGCPTVATCRDHGCRQPWPRHFDREGHYVGLDVEAPAAPRRRADNAGPGDWLNSLTSAERKEVAVSRGLFAYFPDALAFVARHSVRSNEKHNPGEPVHWARGKSDDHEDCIARHSLAVAIDPGSMDGEVPHIACRAWRALAALQLWIEEKHTNGKKV